MAILIYLHKSEETDTEIRYSYGPAKNRQDLTLTIDKATLLPTPDPSSPAPSRVAGWVLIRHRRNNQWPENGVIQS